MYMHTCYSCSHLVLHGLMWDLNPASPDGISQISPLYLSCLDSTDVVLTLLIGQRSQISGAGV